MKGIKYIACIIILHCSLNNVKAQSYLEFVENKGQWDKNISFKGQMTNGSFLLKPDGGYRMVLHNTQELSAIAQYYHGQSNTASDKKSASSNNTDLVLHSHAYEVKFLNANPHPSAVPDKALNTYNNYFIGNDQSKWASNCKIYQAITYKNVYPNVDVRYYTGSTGQLKYDIVVNPGGDVNKIALYFDGADALKIKEGSLSIKTSVDEVKEMPPYSYVVADEGRQQTDCNYEVKGNIVRFTVKNYSPNKTLVIDPTLVFSTFTGSTADNWGYTATYDNAGNFYAGGIVFNTGFPVSNGAFQSSFQGGTIYSGVASGFDMGIIKFDPSGANRIYATYIGGAKGNDQPHSLITDASGNLIIAGRSTSSDYPSPVQNYGSGGGWDIVITKLNATGTALIGSTRIGGTGDDGVNIGDKYGSPIKADASLRRNYGDDSRSEVILDNAGNIYVASCSQSKDFPAINAIQTTNNGGLYKQDAVVIKTDATVSSVLFSTYLGGTGDDAAFVIDLNPGNNNIYVAGATSSSDFPGDNTNTLYPSNQGGLCDGFISILSNDGSQLIKTTYFGTSGADVIYGIKFDKFSFPYITGTTTTVSMPIVNSIWNTSNATGIQQKTGNQFITKLSADLSTVIYSANFGTANATAPNISPTAFLVDRCENVYVSGWGGKGNTIDNYPSAGTQGLAITAGAIQSTTDGSDFYFFVLEKNAQSQLYGSFFGQVNGNYPDHVDGGTSRFDKNGIIYQAVCANCYGGASFPTTPGVWAPINGTTDRTGVPQGCNLAAIKIAFNLAGLSSGVQASVRGIIRDTSGCVPLSASFKDTVGLAKTYIWNFGDGSPNVTTSADTISHTFNLVGVYQIRLVAVDSNSCNISDTSYTTLRVRNDDASLAMSAFKLPPCSSLTFEFDNNSVPAIGKPFKSNSFQLVFGDGNSQITGIQPVQHTYASIGTYNTRLVLLDTNYCNYPDSIPLTIRIAANVKAQFTTPSTGCAPYKAVINNTSVGGAQFSWDFGDGTTSTQANPPVHLYNNVGTYTIRLIVTDTSTCNKVDSTNFTITVSGKPTSSFTYSPQPPQANTAVVFTNNSTGGINYKWVFGDGDSLTTSNILQPVSHIYNATQVFNTCLITTNSSGCMDTVCQPIHAIIVPGFDVPTAFTPNGDGVNDKIFVRGYGIAKMEWQIYNRWGTLVFVSTSTSVGWDGNYKGQLQPQDVYHYTLQLEFSDKSKATKAGDITLLR